MTRRPRSLASACTDGATPWAENTTVAPSGTSSTRNIGSDTVPCSHPAPGTYPCGQRVAQRHVVPALRADVRVRHDGAAVLGDVAQLLLGHAAAHGAVQHQHVVAGARVRLHQDGAGALHGDGAPTAGGGASPSSSPGASPPTH